MEATKEIDIMINNLRDRMMSSIVQAEVIIGSAKVAYHLRKIADAIEARGIAPFTERVSR